MFMSAYQVCQKGGTKVGPLIAYTQQRMLSLAAGNKSPDPRQDFISDHLQFIKMQRIRKDITVTIFLDANERLGDEADGQQQLTETLNLTDIHGNRLDQEQESAIYLRGSK
jgi:hypothetical protein